MVDFGQSLAIGPNEWLTVAARDNENFVLPNDAADVVTIDPPPQGQRFGELRAGRLTPAEVRKRVEVREF